MRYQISWLGGTTKVIPQDLPDIREDVNSFVLAQSQDKKGTGISSIKIHEEVYKIHDRLADTLDDLSAEERNDLLSELSTSVSKTLNSQELSLQWFKSNPDAWEEFSRERTMDGTIEDPSAVDKASNTTMKDIVTDRQTFLDIAGWGIYRFGRDEEGIGSLKFDHEKFRSDEKLSPSITIAPLYLNITAKKGKTYDNEYKAYEKGRRKLIEEEGRGKKLNEYDKTYKEYLTDFLEYSFSINQKGPSGKVQKGRYLPSDNLTEYSGKLLDAKNKVIRDAGVTSGEWVVKDVKSYSMTNKPKSKDKKGVDLSPSFSKYLFELFSGEDEEEYIFDRLHTYAFFQNPKKGEATLQQRIELTEKDWMGIINAKRSEITELLHGNDDRINQVLIGMVEIGLGRPPTEPIELEGKGKKKIFTEKITAAFKNIKVTLVAKKEIYAEWDGNPMATGLGRKSTNADMQEHMELLMERVEDLRDLGIDIGGSN